MTDQFIQYINDHHLFGPQDKVLLAVSGGMDSVAMLQCFKEAQVCDFGVAHCNFGLREEDSDADEAFVKKLAKKAKASFHSHAFETTAFAAQEKISIQMAARQLRYAWFKQVMEDHDYDYLATAHHRNDVLETVLFNLTKGTGIAGLHGIKNKTGKIIRPMLFADKEDILDFIARKNLAWREDSSNASVKYARNLIRHEVIPVLKKVNPDLEHTFQHTVDRIAQVEEVFLERVAQIAKKAFRKAEGNLYIDLQVLKDEQVNPIFLYELIKAYGFNFTQASDLYERLFQGAGKLFDSPTHRLNIDREALIISSRDLSDFIPASIFKDQKEYQGRELHLRFSTQEVEEFKIPNNKKIAALDLDKLKFPLGIRKWHRGDHFFPLGMKKKKKLSDFMIDEKIPLNLKERVLLLTSGEAIVWVIGHRIDDRFKITEATKHVFKAQISPIQ